MPREYRMIPYLYSLMREAHENACAAMRASVPGISGGQKLLHRRASRYFLFGSSVLVANVVEKKEQKQGRFICPRVLCGMI